MTYPNRRCRPVHIFVAGKGQFLSGVIFCLAFFFSAGAAWAEESTPDTNAILAELQASMASFSVVVPVDTATGERRLAQTEAGGVSITRPFAYLDIDAAYVDALRSGAADTTEARIVSAVDLILSGEDHVWLTSERQAEKAGTPQDAPPVFLVQFASGESVNIDTGGVFRTPLFVRYEDAEALAQRARTSLQQAGDTEEISIVPTPFLSVVQGVLSGEYTGLYFVSPKANRNWLRQVEAGEKLISRYETEADIAARELYEE